MAHLKMPISGWSGWGSVGKALTSNSRSPLFESSHQPKLNIYCQLNRCKKRKIKQKTRQRMAHLKNTH